MATAWTNLAGVNTGFNGIGPDYDLLSEARHEYVHNDTAWSFNEKCESTLGTGVSAAGTDDPNFVTAIFFTVLQVSLVSLPPPSQRHRCGAMPLPVSRRRVWRCCPHGNRTHLVLLIVELFLYMTAHTQCSPEAYSSVSGGRPPPPPPQPTPHDN
jgi:hypothetical protein